MNNKNLFYFAGRCLALDENPGFREEIIYKCKNDLIDWQAFVFLCSNELILPSIYIKFKNHNLIEHLPIVLAGHLLDIYKLNANRNRNILNQIEKITRVLNKNNIYPIYLKGAANLLDKLYLDIGERILADIDFLVQKEDFLTAAELLKREGYSIITETPDYIETKDLKHYPRLVHPDFEAVIEIHQSPVDKKYLKWFNSEIIDKEKKWVVNTANFSYFIPSDRHKIINNFIHSQLGDQGNLYGTVSLRSIYDLLLLSKRFPIDTVISEIKKKRKAIAYFALSDLAIGASKSFYPKKNFAFWVLKLKHTLNLNSSIFFHIFRGVIFLTERIFTGYFGRPIRAIFYKDERKAFVGRLRSPEWIHNHISLYTKFFNINRKKENTKE